MRRRNFLVALGAAAVGRPLVAVAQTGKNVRVGVLFAGTEASWVDAIKTFRHGLRERGWIEGQNLTLDFRFAEDNYDRLPALAAELVALNPDLIFAGSAPAVRAATKATTKIPIVIETLGDAVSAGLVPNLGRPGTNVTGVSGFSPGLSAKRLQFIREMLPRATRVAVLANRVNPATQPVVRALEAAAESLRFKLDIVDIRAVSQLEGVFEMMTRQRTDAVVVVSDPMLGGQRLRIAELAAKYRMPTAFDGSTVAGLISYGPGGTERFQQVAEYVDRVLRGAKPADLPLAQPTKFELIVNLKTASALNVTVPQSVLVLADEVIQ